jgi:hypothetical protein
MRVADIPDEYRGKGTTTQQMREAPHGALFVWPVERLHYPRDLARTLRREDLTIVGPAAFRCGGERLFGQRFPAIVIDHACALSAEDWDTYRGLLARCVR